MEDDDFMMPYHSDGGRSAKQQATIDALVAALEYARSELAARGGATMSFPKIDAALALARGEG